MMIGDICCLLLQPCFSIYASVIAAYSYGVDSLLLISKWGVIVDDGLEFVYGFHQCQRGKLLASMDDGLKFVYGFHQ